ncbi:CPBP family intramembrane glutamic endopeptidase [Lacinutrix undariae]
MKSARYKSIEFFIVFILIPVSFVMSYPVWLKLSLSGLGFLYILFLILKVEKVSFKIQKGIDWVSFWKVTALKFGVIAVITSLFVFFTDQTMLFEIVSVKPILWVFILFFYSVFSVYPQELLYRTLYFKRYKDLFKTEWLFVFVNAIVFSLAHLMFKNSLVILITFVGGILFALTYLKTKSTLLVSIEHAIYGCWLFTVGMGAMLGFPT